jgi:hypothetical protein
VSVDVIDSVVIGVSVACAAWVILVLLTLAVRSRRKPAEVAVMRLEPVTFVAENYIPRGALVEVAIDPATGPRVRWKIEAPRLVESGQ